MIPACVHPKLPMCESEAIVKMLVVVKSSRRVSLVCDLCAALALPEFSVGVLPSAPIRRPQSVVVLPNPTLIVAERDAGMIRHIDVDGNELFAFSAPSLVAPMGLCLRHDGSLACCDIVSQRVIVVAPWTGVTLRERHDPRLIVTPKSCVELSDHSLLISCNGAPHKLVIWRPDDALQPLHYNNPGAAHAEQLKPGALAADRGGSHVLVADEQSHSVYELSLSIAGGGRVVVESTRLLVSHAPTEGLTYVSDHRSFLLSHTLECVVQRYSCHDGQLLAVYGAGRGVDEFMLDYGTGLAQFDDQHFLVCDKRNNRVQMFPFSSAA